MSPYPDDPGFERDSDTSEDAAASMVVGAKAMQAIVRRHLIAAERRDPPGHTCDELEVITGGRHQSVSARVRELVLAGIAYDSAVRRLTRSGRKAVVWRIVTTPTIPAVEPGQGNLFIPPAL